MLQSAESKESQHSWVPFRDGVFLCQALELFDELKQSFLKASSNIPEEEENYFLNRRRRKEKLPGAFLNRQRRKATLSAGYEALQWDDEFVMYMPSIRKVNATHLLKLGNIPRTQLAQFFSHNHQVSKQVVAGNAQVQGMYIDFEDAHLLCRHFKLSDREDYGNRKSILNYRCSRERWGSHPLENFHMKTIISLLCAPNETNRCPFSLSYRRRFDADVIAFRHEV